MNKDDVLRKRVEEIATDWQVNQMQLAAAQAREQQLREALKLYIIREGEGFVFANSPAQKALALPADRAALDARLAQEYDRGYQDAKDKFDDLT